MRDDLGSHAKSGHRKYCYLRTSRSADLGNRELSQRLTRSREPRAWSTQLQNGLGHGWLTRLRLVEQALLKRHRNSRPLRYFMDVGPYGLLDTAAQYETAGHVDILSPLPRPFRNHLKISRNKFRLLMRAQMVKESFLLEKPY